MNDSIAPPPHTCAHCGRKSWRNHRRLCRPCYNKPEVRAKYPPIRREDTTTTGVGIARDDEGRRVANHRLPLPDAPTAFMPGTEGKKKVMEERAGRGRQVFHPDDARPAETHGHSKRRPDGGTRLRGASGSKLRALLNRKVL